MLQYAKCYPEHVAAIEPHPLYGLSVAPFVESGELAAMCNSGVAISAWRDFRCVAAAGIFPMWANRGIAWALLSLEVCENHSLELVRAIRSFLDRNRIFKRIEMDVPVSFTEGEKWGRVLGFTVAQPLARAYYPDGTDAMLMERIN